MCGIPRSGSTLVWQIFDALHLVDTKVERTHPAAWEPDGRFPIVTIRNPHDIAASLYRVRISRGGKDVGNEFGLDVVLGRTELYFSHLPKVLRVKHLLLRYEEFYRDHNVIYDAFSDLFQTYIYRGQRLEISERFSVAANRARAAKMKDFNEIGEADIRGDHIGPVLPGSWKEVVPEWGWEKVEEICAPIAKEWDYE